MENTTTLEFCFKGNRNYVHGTDIFNNVIEYLQNKMQNKNFDMSFHGVASKNLEITYQKPEDETLLKFACKYMDEDSSRKVLYGIENNDSIKCRYEYPEDSICNLAEMDLSKEEVVLEKSSSFSFVENVVAINKYLLENIFPDVTGKWYFTRLQVKEIPEENIYPMKLHLKANFNFKLTKTEILINNKPIGFIYFSLV